jgi:hypothetical protein
MQLKSASHLKYTSSLSSLEISGALVFMVWHNRRNLPLLSSKHFGVANEYLPFFLSPVGTLQHWPDSYNTNFRSLTNSLN